jgi:hypothetical protein
VQEQKTPLPHNSVMNYVGKGEFLRGATLLYLAASARSLHAHLRAHPEWSTCASLSPPVMGELEGATFFTQPSGVSRFIALKRA